MIYCFLSYSILIYDQKIVSWMPSLHTITVLSLNYVNNHKTNHNIINHHHVLT